MVRSRRRLRERAPEIAFEALSIVFAVLLALALDEWNQDREREGLAARVRDAVETEVARNLDELRATMTSNDSLRVQLDERRDALDRPAGAGTESATIAIYFTLAELSSAAWHTVQMMDAAPYMDYAWLGRVSTAYDAQAIYEQRQLALLDLLSMPAERDLDDLGAVELLASRLSVLMQLGRALEEEYVGLIEETDAG